MSGCLCSYVKEDPTRRGYCQHCSGILGPEWQTTDATVSEFMDQLGEIPGVVPAFIKSCRAREMAGRDEFGYEYLKRSNCDEGIEEFADACLYSFLHLLRCRREGKREQIELALEISRHAAEGAALFARMKALG